MINHHPACQFIFAAPAPASFKFQTRAKLLQVQKKGGQNHYNASFHQTSSFSSMQPFAFCLICYEEKCLGEELVRCRQCSTEVHSHCQARWSAHRQGRNLKARCPTCWQLWRPLTSLQKEEPPVIDFESIEAELCAARCRIRSRVRDAIECALNRRSCLREPVIVVDETDRELVKPELAPRSATRALAYLERYLNANSSFRVGATREGFGEIAKHWDRLTSPTENHPRSLAPLFDLAAQVRHRKITILRASDRADLSNDVLARLAVLDDIDQAIRNATTLFLQVAPLLSRRQTEIHDRLIREQRQDHRLQEAHHLRFASLSSLSILTVS